MSNNKAIEAAAVAMLANGLNHTAYDAEDLATYALESATPSIAAQALREAADQAEEAVDLLHQRAVLRKSAETKASKSSFFTAAM